MLMSVAEGIISGIMIGGVYSLVALGIVVVFKSTRVITFTQGGLLLMGAITGWALLGPAGLPVGLGVVLTLAACAFLGMCLDRFTLRPIIGQPILASIMVTIALAWLFDSVGTLIIGGGLRPYPPLLPHGTYKWGRVYISQSLLLQFIIAVLLFIAFTLFYKYGRLGLAMRGTAEDHTVVQSLGIKVTNIFSYSWVIAALSGGVSGILLASTLGATVGLSGIGMKALVVVLIGGMESIPGVILMGPIIGILENLSIQFLDPLVGGGLGEVVPYAVMLIVLLVKPYGLFGLKRIERI
ncbi:MAG: branched-chain amino acid ABC transporter permease [Proteobacteria bacterium]|nr:branched-chain amino acid ABC transporter permease [Pseudomonadota bacterium]